jgi:hypothetical protein
MGSEGEDVESHGVDAVGGERQEDAASGEMQGGERERRGQYAGDEKHEIQWWWQPRHWRNFWRQPRGEGDDGRGGGMAHGVSYRGEGAQSVGRRVGGRAASVAAGNVWGGVGRQHDP